jgi:hypothetical protein
MKMASEDSAARPRAAAKLSTEADGQIAFLSFDDILLGDRTKLIKAFSGREELAREFWDAVGSGFEAAQMFGCSLDLRMTRAGSTASDVKNRMDVVYNSCRRLLKALDTETCNHLVHPPNLARLNSLQREERQLKMELLRSLLVDVATDADPDNGWDKVKPLRFRLDYMLVATIQTEVECADAEHGLSAPAMVTLVFDILGIGTEAKDAIKGAKQIFSG